MHSCCARLVELGINNVIKSLITKGCLYEKKSVSFEDYALARVGNEDKTYGEVLDIAWENSKERKEQMEDLISKIVLVSFVALIPIQLVSIPIADTREIILLMSGM